MKRTIDVRYHQQGGVGAVVVGVVRGRRTKNACVHCRQTASHPSLMDTQQEANKSRYVNGHGIAKNKRERSSHNNNNNQLNNINEF